MTSEIHSTQPAPANPVSQDDLLAAIRSAIADAGGQWIGIQKFLDFAGLRRADVYKFFPSWNEALHAAGFTFERYNKPIDTEALLTDWGLVARKLKRLPPSITYRVHGRYSQATFQRRFGNWNEVARAFHEFAGGKPEWADVLPLCAKLLRDNTNPAPASNPVPFAHSHLIIEPSIAPQLNDRPVYGEPLDFPGLRNAPTNETGVVLAFGLLAPRLGFHIQSVQTAFPDCEALRRVSSGHGATASESNVAWQTVKIEFEYQSANFLYHKHPPDGCDVIVCWIDNWPTRPPQLEVIALSEQIKRLL